MIVISVLYIKGKIKLMLNPIYAILLGYFVLFNVTTFLLIFFPLSKDSLLSTFLIIAISVFIGGFVATFFSKNNKILFGIIVGIFIWVFILVIGFRVGFVDITTAEIFIVSNTIISLLSASLGGFIANKCKEFIIKKRKYNISEYQYCIRECTSLQNKYNQLLKGEHIHIPELISDCEDLISKFTSLNVGKSNEYHKSIMIGNVQNILTLLKKISLK